MVDGRCREVGVESLLLLLDESFFTQVSILLLEFRMCVLLPPLQLFNTSVVYMFVFTVQADIIWNE